VSLYGRQKFAVRRKAREYSPEEKWPALKGAGQKIFRR
jgi:hypothetical protein